MEAKGFSVSGSSIQARSSFKSDEKEQKMRPVNTPPETWSTDDQENFRPAPADAADRKPIRMQRCRRLFFSLYFRLFCPLCIVSSLIYRASAWSVEVENSYRYQLAGFRDETEYLSMFPSPECWEAGGMVKCLRAKKTGYYMYFRQSRECEDKHLNKVKLYEY
jgi:hypothetical protein